MSAQKASTHYNGSFTLQGEVLAGREAGPAPGLSLAEVLRSLA
jgi:hypothetical protein